MPTIRYPVFLVQAIDVASVARLWGMWGADRSRRVLISLTLLYIHRVEGMGATRGCGRTFNNN